MTGSSRTTSRCTTAVCLLDEWLEDSVLQSIGAENNLSETAFLGRKGDGWKLRWFTPLVEVDLCGHATLASAYVLFTFVEPGATALNFETMSGPLAVEKRDGMLWMNFPSRPPSHEVAFPEVIEALGEEPVEIRAAERDCLAVFDSEEEVMRLAPDFVKLKAIENVFAVCATAPGGDCDFVSRFFAPAAGINEDPVTGSAHCSLIPYWANRLGKDSLHARRISRRGGEVFCESRGERVGIGGNCVLFAEGEIVI